MPYLSQLMAGEYEKRKRFFFFVFPWIHEMMSCITPNGQITEQYTLPKRRVRTVINAMTPKLSASTAGRNWTFAIHPSQAWMDPVKSRKRSVTPMKNIDARMILIFRSIVVSLTHICANISKKSLSYEKLPYK